VVDTHEIAGNRIVDIIDRPIITEILDNTLFGQANLSMAEVPVMAGSTLIGHSLKDVRLGDDYNLILVGIVDRAMGENFIYSTEGHNLRLDVGDVLVVIGPNEEIDRIRQDLAP